MIQKIKTIVCGSTFGQYYIDALKSTMNSLKLQDYWHGEADVPLHWQRKWDSAFTDIDKIPEDIVLACVVIRSEGVGGEGCEVAQRLMERGIHIIQEQPIYPKTLWSAIGQQKI